MQMIATRVASSNEAALTNLTRYLQEIRVFSPLPPEEELNLARRWADHRDRAAADKLVTSHLGLIVKIANAFRGYGLQLSELVGEGNVGIMQAIERFDPAMGFRFSTYARWWIRAAILEYILRSYSMVRLCTTPAQRRLFFKLRKLKSQLQQIDDGDLKPEIVARIAAHLDVSHGDVITMNRRMTGPDQSLNTPVAADGEEEWQDWLIDQTPDQEAVLADRQEEDERRNLLQQAMKHLNERESHVLSTRRLRERPLKLEELATHYGVSRERIRQIEERAFLKIQEALGLVAQRPRRTIQPTRLSQLAAGLRDAVPPPKANSARAQPEGAQADESQLSALVAMAGCRTARDIVVR
jgi:RNA polymerase sigma-32 factor